MLQASIVEIDAELSIVELNKNITFGAIIMVSKSTFVPNRVGRSNTFWKLQGTTSEKMRRAFKWQRQKLLV